ncbi:hypothetical protein Tco_0762282 [Tanacetum coccineum]
MLFTVSSVNNFVHDPNQISYDETPDSHQQPPRNCSNCGVENHSLNLNPNSFIDSPNIFNPPPQPQTYSCELCGNDAHYGYDCPLQVPLIKDYHDEKIDIEIKENFNGMSIEINKKKKLQQVEQVANLNISIVSSAKFDSLLEVFPVNSLLSIDFSRKLLEATLIPEERNFITLLRNCCMIIHLLDL